MRGLSLCRIMFNRKLILLFSNGLTTFEKTFPLTDIPNPHKILLKVVDSTLRDACGIKIMLEVMNNKNSDNKDNLIPIIALSLFLGFAYLCYGALYLSSSGIVKNVPAPMSLLIFSIVPVYFLFVPAIIAISIGIIIYMTVQMIRGKQKYSLRIVSLYSVVLILGVGFLLAVHHSIPNQ